MGQETDDERKPLVRRQTRLESGDYDSPRSYTDPLYGLSRPKRRAACSAIVTTEMFERLAFYGFTANLVLFLNGDPFVWLSYEAANTVLIFFGITYMCSVLAGWIADTMLGRFKTILISFIIYICGAALLTLVGYASRDASAHPESTFIYSLCGKCPLPTPNSTAMVTIAPIPTKCPEHYCSRVIVPAILLIAIGTGATRSNLSPFGADQVKYEGPEVMRMFFNWFYWAANVGSFLAIGGIVCVQQNVDFFYGFLIPGIALVLATLVFFLGRVVYLSKKPMGSVLTNTRRIIGEACRRRKQRKRLYVRQDSDQVLRSNPYPSFLDMAKTRFGGSFHESMVEDVKALGKVILVFIALIPYWAVYFQMQTTFLLQGLHMKFSTESWANDTVPNCTDPDSADKHQHHMQTPIDGPFQIPAAWLTLFDIIVVLILVPVMDRIIYPRLDKSGYNFSHLRRIAIGMLFSALAMLAAGTLEVFRKKKMEDDGHCIHMQAGYTNYFAADMWIFYQIPQYILIGAGEVFTSVAGLEFAYSQAPRSMQGLIMGLFYMSMGLGSFLSSGILALLSVKSIEWFTPRDIGNINFVPFSRVFFLFAGIQTLALIIFVIASYHYERSSAVSDIVPVSPSSRNSQRLHVQRRPVSRTSSIEGYN